MANITAADVSKLRNATGAGMMDCKKALVESDGDFDKAIEIIRKKGQAMANKRADREASEGVVLAKVNDSRTKAVMVVMNCETDFVAKNEGFVALAQSILDVALNNNVKDIEALKQLKVNGKLIADAIMEEVGKIGEKIDISLLDILEAPSVIAYIHAGNKLATMVGFNIAGIDLQVSKDIAMQVAAMNPVAIDKDFVSQSVIDKELEIGMEQARNEGKPEAMLEKIAQGKLGKFFKDSTLLNQEFIKDNKKTVRQYLQETNKELTVTAFKRYTLNA